MNVFISYSTRDERLARQIHSQLAQVGAQPFLASLSLAPGARWTAEIFSALEESDMVFFIASRDACASPAVQQELGASLAQKKLIIPILTDISPDDLPGWTKEHQAIDLKSSPEALMRAFAEIGEHVRRDRFWTGIILGALSVALIAILSRK